MVKKNQNGQMSYMENHFDKRLNQSIGWKIKCSLFVVELLSRAKQNEDAYKISKYAYGGLSLRNQRKT
jgi:epoxyqueuosine reductase